MGWLLLFGSCLLVFRAWNDPECWTFQNVAQACDGTYSVLLLQYCTRVLESRRRCRESPHLFALIGMVTIPSSLGVVLPAALFSTMFKYSNVAFEHMTVIIISRSAHRKQASALGQSDPCLSDRSCMSTETAVVSEVCLRSASLHGSPAE